MQRSYSAAGISSQGSLYRSASKNALRGQVRGGGCLYIEPPLSHYTEEEMIAEAQLRIAHNKQRRRMKQLLSAASDDGSNVATKDLLLAAKLAKMDLPDAMIADTPYATVRAASGCLGVVSARK